ncbi:MAG: sugar nucleotide-binding protein, partial [Bacteroidota bacterium]
LPYREDDKTAPDTVYGHTKLDGERAVEASGADYMIIRTSWLYSPFGHNFVKTMIRLGQENESLNVVYDQVGSPTSAHDLARGVLEIIDKVSSGIYPFVSGVFHYSNEGVCSWYDFAVAIHKLAGIECAVHPIDTENYPAPAKRPHYSVLNKQKIKAAYDLEIPHWETSLELIVNRILNP